jgi:hypothetical protein
MTLDYGATGGECSKSLKSNVRYLQPLAGSAQRGKSGYGLLGGTREAGHDSNSRIAGRAETLGKDWQLR